MQVLDGRENQFVVRRATALALFAVLSLLIQVRERHFHCHSGTLAATAPLQVSPLSNFVTAFDFSLINFN